ncbi:hypothetical protein LCGC14_2577920 [marine sediment metagenome]|uniref:Uncharacterized protein n=1 Tax=marine sediment metagenome TaxID=412755 RepID=A0A0F9AFR2_9ZZZZ
MEDEEFTVSDWQREVKEGDTRLDYLTWVEDCKEAESNG